VLILWPATHDLQVAYATSPESTLLLPILAPDGLIHHILTDAHNQQQDAFNFAMTIVGNQTNQDLLRHRRWFLGNAAPAALVLFALVRPARAEQAGTVEDIKGEAFAQAVGPRRTLVLAAPILVGDEVSTERASRLGLRLGQDTTIRLGELAHLKIDRFLVDTGGELTLESGPLLFDRPAGSAPVSVQIRSPSALIAVRGTRFFAGPSKGRFGVFVEHGSVTVTAAGQQAVVGAGQGTDIPFVGAPPTPVQQWGPPRIRAAMDSVS